GTAPGGSAGCAVRDGGRAAPARPWPERRNTRLGRQVFRLPAARRLRPLTVPRPALPVAPRRPVAGGPGPPPSPAPAPAPLAPPPTGEGDVRRPDPPGSGVRRGVAQRNPPPPCPPARAAA